MSVLEQIVGSPVVTRQSVLRHRGPNGWTLRATGDAIEDLDEEMFAMTVLSNRIDRLTRRIAQIGLLLAGAFLASGWIDGKAVEVIRAVIFGN